MSRLQRITGGACAHRARKKHAQVFARLREHTMVPESLFIANLELAARYSSVRGAVVECGTWRGGMVAGIATVCGQGRRYYLFDSFEGLPEAKDIDGEAAVRWQEDTTSPTYYDNCRASEEDARHAMALAGIHDPVVVKGWFRDTLPATKFPDGIAILRMDGDWYESTTEIFNHLFKHVNDGGLMIIDDYYMWDGCSRAVHDFLSRRQCREKIDAYKGVCFIEKA